MALSIDFTAPIDAQIAQAKAAGVVLPAAYYRLPAEKRAQAFTVSGLARLDQVQAVADALARAQAEGSTFADFKKWAAGQDWSLPKHRLETIYRNAVQTAYQAGHWRDFEENAQHRPYLMYDAINDSRVRPVHLALDGVIRPVGDAYWKTHAPSLGHRCRCGLRSLSRPEAMRRGGATQNPPAEGQADAGWGHKPTDGFKGLLNSIDTRLGKCRVNLSAQFANVRSTQPLWCDEGPFRDHLLMQQTWAQRGGRMPEPRPLVLQSAPFVSAEKSFEQFMQALGSIDDVLRVALPSGDTVVVSDDLFRTLDGRWKISKRGRDQWLMYLAELIKSPQEVWRLKLAQTEELYLLGRFQRGRQRLDAIAVFKREGDEGDWSEGKTGFVADGDKYLFEKRDELMKKASLRWLDLERDEGRR
jgi:SPP1 gp7 family putative phage head morphogenesis protein